MREETLNRYCQGRGLEIGPGEHPLPLQGRELTYFDMVGAGSSIFGRKIESNIPIVEGQAEELSQYFPSRTFDFLASSHVLEHCKRPMSALWQWAKVVKPQGWIWLALPLKEECFDRDRPNTDISHLLADEIYFAPEPHYREWFLLGPDKLTGEALEERIRQAISGNENIHFHAWDELGWAELLGHFYRNYGLFKIAEQKRNGHEVIFVLQKI